MAERKRGTEEKGRQLRRILLVVAYDGTDYSGFALQKGEVRTILGELQAAVRALTGEESELIGASRTDAGVHALCNFAVFDTCSRIPGDRFAYALNIRLPQDIRVQSSREVPADFHPRFLESVKTYEYRIYNAALPDPTRDRYAAFSYTPFDVESMRQAAGYLVGEHDFRSFASIYTQALTTVRTITEVSVLSSPCAPLSPAEPGESRCYGMNQSSVERLFGPDPSLRGRGQREDRNRAQMPREIVIRVSGTGFLYNMVRIIAGTLMEVGRGAIPPEKLRDILAACDRRAAGPTAPACGLTLVRYEILGRKEHRESSRAVPEQEPESGKSGISEEKRFDKPAGGAI